MKEIYGIKKSFKVKIKKKIPFAAGLAGGSADASCVLKAINEMCKLGLSIQELEKVAVNLGCDVVYCLHEQLARVTSFGEKIELLDKKIRGYVIIVNPLIQLKTSIVYERHKISKVHGDIESFLKEDNYLNFIHNDLENTSIKIEPIIKEMLEDFETLGVKAIMSGSGATVVGFCDTKDIAKNIEKKMVIKYPFVKVAKIRG